MRDVLVRLRYLVASAIVLSVVVTADGRGAAPARRADAEARPRVAAVDRETHARTVPRIIWRIVKALSDGLTGPRP